MGLSQERDCVLQVAFHLRLRQLELVGDFGPGHAPHVTQHQARSMDRLEVSRAEDPFLERWRSVLWYAEALFVVDIPGLHHAAPPQIARAIADNRQYPRRQLRAIDLAEFPVQGEKGFGGEIFSQFPPAHEA